MTLANKIEMAVALAGAAVGLYSLVLFVKDKFGTK